MIMQVAVLTHVDFENSAGIGQWAEARGHKLTVYKMHQGDQLPQVEGVDFLVVMGGPMNIYDHDMHPWLLEEKVFLRQAVQSGVPTIGVCLGAQLLADVLGARVFKNTEPEIGFYPVTLTAEARSLGLFASWPKTLETLHWHGDTFDIPSGAVPLGASKATANQGFVYQNRVIGLQFHMEATPQNWDALIDNCGEEIVPGRFVQSADEMRTGYGGLGANRVLMDALLDSLVAQHG